MIKALCHAIVVATLLLLPSAAVTAAADPAPTVRAGVELPAALELGGESLVLASCGVRDTLWIEHYVAALYLLPGQAVTAALRDAAQPKIILMQVVREASLPERIPEQWRAPLRAELARDPLARVRAAYGSLSAGDRVKVKYMRPEGLTMTVNERVVASAVSHDLIDAILQTWADGDPLSGKLHRLLLANPC